MIIPAIDLQNGQAVRLFKGDYAQKTVYSDNPVTLAKSFEKLGAKYLHIVDLDGAKSGSTANLETIKQIRAAVRIPIQVGGGIRSAEAIELYLGIGVNRVILGTVAAQNPDFVKQMIEKHGAERIVVGVDVRENQVSISGWTQDSGKNYLDFVETLKQLGVQIIILTDIAKDGTLTSPNWSLYEQIKGINVIVSGGVSCAEDVRRARRHYGVIVGKALYENKVDLPVILSLSKDLAKRLVVALDIKDGKVVKSIKFKGFAEIGDPVELANCYWQQGASEIMILDVTAATGGKRTSFDIVKTLAKSISIPITVGGGISTVEDCCAAFKSGAAKVLIGSAAVKNPEFLREASLNFGKHRILVTIDAKKIKNGYTVFTGGGANNSGVELIKWAKQCEELGAGEILLNSIDTDGVQGGFDLKMTKAVVDAVAIPVIASGGCGSVADIVEVFEKTNCDAALVASLLHYGKATVNDIKEALR